MNDWLSEIEYIYMLIERPPKRGGRKSMAKMARVLREQSEYIKASHEVEQACIDFDPVDISQLRKARKQAWEKMSPDAKELLK